MSKPLIVQSDKTVLLEVDNPAFQECRIILSRFSELEKSPEYLHTYRITTLSLWHAASMKMTSDEILDCLHKYSRYKIPQNIENEIKEQISRYGKIKLKKNEIGELFITTDENTLLKEIAYHKVIQSFIEHVKEDHIIVKKDFRGHIKQALVKAGFPIEDLAGYDEGNKYGFNLRLKTKKNKSFIIRDYQKNSISTFYTNGSIEGGSGVIVLPCGAGKTIVGIGVMQIVGFETLILVTNTLSIRQWKDEILDKTNIPAEDVGEYSGEVKEIKPITIATYNILTHRKNRESAFSHFYLFSARNWGLIIYDEVHLLPAPVFRMTSGIQAKRRLGLTATLVREDGLEEDVFSLIGPKKYDVPWKELENKAWIATAKCIEIRIDMQEEYKMQYVVANEREKFRLSSENPEKIKAIKVILEHHKNFKTLIIGQYIKQLEAIAEKFSIHLITGQTNFVY